MDVTRWPGEGPHPGPGSQEMKWAVVVREPLETALAPAYRVRNLILIVGFLLGLGFAALGWVITGCVTGPLKRIATPAERLRQGDDIELPNIQGAAEIHSLSTSLRALRDPLTGLLNRSGLDERFNEEAAWAQKDNSSLLVFLSDLEGLQGGQRRTWPCCRRRPVARGRRAIPGEHPGRRHCRPHGWR